MMYSMHHPFHTKTPADGSGINQCFGESKPFDSICSLNEKSIEEMDVHSRQGSAEVRTLKDDEVEIF